MTPSESSSFVHGHRPHAVAIDLEAEERIAASPSRVECCAASAAPWIGCAVATSGPMRTHNSPGCSIAVRQSVQQPLPAPGAQDP
jgi:hypothetical protein